ncbi:hypothetical protein EV2_018090 [Malus domestica]
MRRLRQRESKEESRIIREENGRKEKGEEEKYKKKREVREKGQRHGGKEKRGCPLGSSQRHRGTNGEKQKSCFGSVRNGGK